MTSEPLWRPVPQVPGYEVSENGAVRRTLPGHKTYIGKLLRPKRHQFGYPRYGLTIQGKKKSFEAHILVLLAFCGPKPFPRAEARHHDGNPQNNHISNLSWSTHRDNQADKGRHGTDPVGSRNGFAKLTEADIPNIRRDYAEMKSLTKVGAKYNVEIGRAHV